MVREMVNEEILEVNCCKFYFSIKGNQWRKMDKREGKLDLRVLINCHVLKSMSKTIRITF
jgi:hypothetical protein